MKQFTCIARRIKLTIAAFLVLLSSACQTDFLDSIPDKSLVVPRTAADLQAILDNTTKMSIYYPSVGEIASDDYFIESNIFNSQTDITARNAYIWADDLFNERDGNDWSYSYVTIFYANIVLETLKKWEKEFDPLKKDELRGSALFFRAYALYNLSQIFCNPYIKEHAVQDLGLPLRLDSDLTKKSVRSSLEETYDQIIQDTQQALTLLPLKTTVKTRPAKAAAWGLLARIYLSMSNFEGAAAAADNCMQLTSARLIDYNEVDGALANPFPRFNEEVIFHSLLLGKSFLSSYSLVDTVLYDSYEESDLRKELFYKTVSAETNRFRGSYDGRVNLFGGIALDEMYLIKAECLVRQNQIELAVETLNSILKKRYSIDGFTPVKVMPKPDLLKLILDHRRKELVFRGIRWSDLRRLNLDVDLQTTLQRKINGQLYELKPNDPRYTFPIPDKIIQMTGMQQNDR